ncbi:uncharacterized protein LOC132562337 [Ylistrum balloti]|uniref:uncharacterized protein LOC132562337 n=1 Tax=Ylistrum balloti TaxID=509963 RepID=UPI0029059F91|nr:uncharacterized protein LOC132562337 [Ylistrum balloti]XP_060083059.1 uncharacterized protein LOC132562337 [Ylistrum balloti]
MNRWAVFTCAAILSVCLLGAVVGILYGLKPFLESKPSHNIFNDPFTASFDVDTIEREELGTEKTYLKVEWHPASRKMNFQHTEVFSSNYDFDYDLSLIMADSKATVGISHKNMSLGFCIDDMSLSRWYVVFQQMVSEDKWFRGDLSTDCHGDIWSTKHKNDVIEICVKDNQLKYIKYQERRATINSWTKANKQIIRIKADVLNGPCRNVTPITCNVENHPKVKRDSKTSPTKCLFVHGAGNFVDRNDVKSYMEDYWGDIKKHTLDCASHQFLVYNSRDNGWDEDQIHQHFCNVAATNGIISNTVLFSHSMGNMVIAAALHRKKCAFNQSTSRWFSVQGPWKGSAAANTLVDICRNPTSSQKLIRRLLRNQGYCKPTEDIEYNVYTTLKTNYVSDTGIRHDDLINIGRRYVSGVMCGTSSWGLGQDKQESTALKMMQYYSELGKPNDGMVAFDSCKLKDEVFEARSSNPYYKDKVNHADGTCRHGGCPCRWYHNMH